jgi:DNA-binding winged helix-turn-helix (wHTH) protein/Tol biopolymer transport system component
MKPNGDGTKQVRFGAYEVDGAAHELRKHGVKVKLQEQPWEVLCALLEHPGDLVTREELTKRLWPDGTFVDYDQSLNKAVTKLREALCDDADKPRYVETVPRKGYRFIGTIETPAPTAVTAPPPSRRHRWRWWWWTAGILVAATLITGLWPVAVPKVVRVVQLTNDGRPKARPLVSDGTRVFYGSKRKEIWEVPVSGGEPRQFPLAFVSERLVDLTNEIFLIPSPVGSNRIWLGLASPGAIDIWTVNTDGSSPRSVAHITSGGIAASRDGGSLAVSTPNQVKIIRPNSKTGEFSFNTASTNPGSLWWHPDGRTIGFVHNGYDVKEARVYQVGTDGTGLRRIVPEREDFQGAGDWSDDGNRFIYWGEDGAPWIRVRPGLLGWMRRATVTKLVPGLVLVGMPAFSGLDAKSILQIGRILRAELLRFNLGSKSWVPFGAGFTGDCARYSPDRQWIAYIRFPACELHVRRVDGSGDIVLAPGMQAYNPAWSPDGKTIAFAGTPPTTTDPFTIWTVSAKGGSLKNFAPTILRGFDPTWSPDGRRLVFAPFDDPRHSSEWKTQIVEIGTNRVEELPGKGYFSTRWSPDGKKILALRRTDLTLWIFDFNSGEWRQITSEPVGFPEWSEDSKFIYGWRGDRYEIGKTEVSSGKFEKIAEIAGFHPVGNIGVWVGWTPEWEPLVLRDLSSEEVYRIDLDR